MTQLAGISIGLATGVAFPFRRPEYICRQAYGWIVCARRLFPITPYLPITLAAAARATRPAAALLPQLHLSPPYLALIRELPRPYALYRVTRQRRYRNAPAV